MEGDRKAADPRLPGCAISIHSLRMEGDMATSYVPSGTSVFQSTPSAWRETEIVPTLILSKYISIHSLRMEGDVSFLLRFQSMCISIHSLRMEGDYKIVLNGTYGISISIHSLRMEGDKAALIYWFFCKCWGRRKQRSFGKNQMRTAF